MKEILEAAKFYHECLNEVRKSLIAEDVLPFNTIVNISTKLFTDVSLLSNQNRLVGKFILNGLSYDFSVPVHKKLDVSELRQIASEQIGKAIFDRVIGAL